MALALAVAAQDRSATGKDAPRVEPNAVAPRAEDVSSIDGMIRAWYEIVSGPAG
ncbi:MAG: hypothetical protein RJA59_583, partial [Pseudomonadota bacterium]